MIHPVKISIVIPAFNEERLLNATLIEIKMAANAFTQHGWEVEFIVCDNNSTDHTAEIARGAGASVVFEPINQIGRARNRGAQAATGSWLVFVDADSHPSAELFAEIAEQILSGQCLAGGSTIRIGTDDRTARSITWLWNRISRMRKLLAGSLIFCDAAAFRKIGGFSDQFFAGEELELTRRLRKHAKQTGKRIVILHRHPLVTSARKMHLYTKREHLRFLAKIIFSQGRALTNREATHLWYDGRR
jgi:glycosyltransferase involved in cell wall biosynthesis